MITKIQNSSMYTAKPYCSSIFLKQKQSDVVSFNGYNSQTSIEMERKTVKALSGVFNLLKKEDEKVAEQLDTCLDNFKKSKNNVKVYLNSIPKQIVKLFVNSDILNVEFGQMEFGSHLYRLDASSVDKIGIKHHFLAHFEKDSRFMSASKDFRSITNSESSDYLKAVDVEANYYLTELLEHYLTKVK